MPGEKTPEVSYFDEALSNLTTSIAYKDAIKRMYDKGLSTEEIIRNCMYPVNETIVSNVIKEYEESKSRPKSVFVEEYDQFGRKSFRKKEAEN